MGPGEASGYLVLSIIGLCGLAIPSTATKEGWPINVHLASWTGRTINAGLTTIGVGLAFDHGSLESASALLVAAVIASYGLLRYTRFRAHPLIFFAELAACLWVIGRAVHQAWAG